MTAEKIVIMFLSVFIFILSISIYRKSMQCEKKYIFSSILGSSALGLSSLLIVFAIGLFSKKIIELNLCTILISLLGSLPAVAAMLFINVI